jgi:hypothetical protein
VPLAIPLIVLLALFVSMGMATLQRNVSGGFVQWAASAFRKIPLFGGFTIDQIVKMDRFVTHQLGRAFNAVESQGVKWLTDLSHYQDVVGYWSLYWPIGLYHAVHRLLTHSIPRAVTARTAPLSRQVDAAEAQAKAAAGIAHTLPRTVKAHDRTQEVTRIETVAMPHAGEWNWIHDHFDTLKKSVAAAAAGAIGLALPHAPSLPVPWGLTARQLRRRLGRAEALLGVTAFTAVLAATLGVSVRCLRPTGPLSRVSRRLCGLSGAALNDLLSLIADVLIITEICEVIPLMEQGFNVIAEPLSGLIGEAGAALCGGDFDPPPTLSLPTLSLPALVGVTAVEV